MTETPKVVTSKREIAAGADRIFELIADPARQPLWDGNKNLAEAATGQRVRAEGDVFTMELTNGQVRANRIVEFEEGRRIAWLPSEPGKEPPATCGGGNWTRSTKPGPRSPTPTTGPG
ncbi:hypothetical protein GCM10029964_028570 [Kibdelosporangium lantanae]